MNPHDSLPGSSAGRPPAFEMRPRLLAAFLAMGVVILAASLFAALIVSNVDSGSERMLDDLSKRASMVARLRQEFLLLRVAEKNLIIEDTQEGMDVFEKRITDSEAQIDKVLAEFDGGADDAQRVRVAEVRAGLTDFRSSLRATIELSRANTLARAAELSRGKGRESFQRGREALISLIERNRARIADEASTHADLGRAGALTLLVATARDTLEGMHDLQYLEQAILTVFSNDERAALSGRLEGQEARVRAYTKELGSASNEADRQDVAAFIAALDAWAANNREVCRLAQEDSKSKAMALSTSAVRDAYLRSSQTLDQMMEESDRALADMRSAQEKALTTGRGLLIGTAAAGLLVVGMTAWIVVALVMKEFRAAGDVLMRGA